MVRVLFITKYQTTPVCFTEEELCFWELPTHLRICSINKLKLQFYLKIKLFCRPSWIIYHILFYMISFINQSKPITKNAKGKQNLHPSEIKTSVAWFLKFPISDSGFSRMMFLALESTKITTSLCGSTFIKSPKYWITAS